MEMTAYSAVLVFLEIQMSGKSRRVFLISWVIEQMSRDARCYSSVLSRTCIFQGSAIVHFFTAQRKLIREKNIIGGVAPKAFIPVGGLPDAIRILRRWVTEKPPFSANHVRSATSRTAGLTTRDSVLRATGLGRVNTKVC